MILQFILVRRGLIKSNGVLNVKSNEILLLLGTFHNTCSVHSTRVKVS